MATNLERTAKTKARLLDATIEVLIERGYRGASTPLICRRAKVSRGAQLHHFPTRNKLVAAAVEHLVAQRLEDLQRRLQRAGPGSLEDLGGFLLRIYSGDTFYAWLELVVASRTDEKLRRLLAEVDVRFAERAQQLVRTFLLPDEKDEEVAAMTRLVLAIFDGLATHRILSGSDVVAKRALRRAAAAGLFKVKGGTR